MDAYKNTTGRTKAALPLNVTAQTTSTMILPPMASEIDLATKPEWTSGDTYAYGDIVISNGRVYWCITTAGGVAGATAPVHTDGDASDDTLTWRVVRWFRNVLTIVNTSTSETVSIARGNPAEALKGIVLYPRGAHNEGFDGHQPYAGAWYAIATAAADLSISEG